MSISICDFCSDPHVVWRYPAESFVAYAVAGIVGESVGDWAACRICHELIESGDHIGLLERTLGALFDKHPDMQCSESEVRAQIAALHQMFFAHQLGAALPVV